MRVCIRVCVAISVKEAVCMYMKERKRERECVSVHEKQVQR